MHPIEPAEVPEIAQVARIDPPPSVAWPNLAPGLAGDGVTDDTTALQAALTAAGNGPDLVLLPRGTFRITNRLSIPSGVTLRGMGRGATTLLMDNLAHGVAHYCLTAIGGVAAQGYSLTADGLRGSRTLTLSSSGIGSLGVAAGDVIWVQSEAQALNIAGHKKADLYFVLAVADTTITVAGDLLDSYLVADSASVWKVAPRSHVQIEDLAITAAAYDSSPTTPLSLDCRVSDSEIEDLRDDPVSVPSVLGYGVVLEAATRGCAVVGNTIRRCRHGITTGTAAYWSKPNYGVPRGLAITGNTVSDCTGAAIDTHGDVDGITITGATTVRLASRSAA